ncbi:FixW_protein [Hexamita inflata]|uniref:Putative n=1 Tax=Hexamita inflata TaxID=28002 RepID=A0AA86NYK5_9EUKA|nr:FixW protein [Hexamita inflata]CAI9941160.1 FixW protein [Hexamita inflata]
MSLPDLSQLVQINQISEYAEGMPVLIICYSTTNGRSITSVPHIIEIATKFPTLYTLVLSQENEAHVKQIVENSTTLQKLNVSISTDNMVATILQSLAVETTPHAFLYSTEQKLVWHGEIADSQCMQYIATIAE